MATTTNRVPELAAAMILFSVLSLIAFSLRIMTRSLISKSLGREDVLLAVALVLFLVYCSLYLTQVHDGLIRHIDTLSLEQITEALKLIYAGELLYTASATVLQISIATVLLRITSSKPIRGVIWTVIILCITIGITLFAMIAFQCQPVSYVWDHNLPGGHCMKPNVRTGAAYAYAAVSCLSNWTLGILPWIICRHLTNRRQRYQVAGLLCFANLGSIATTIRFYAIHHLLETEDFFVSSVPLAAWSAVEVGTGIVAVSMSALYPLQQRLRRKRGSTYDGMTVVVPEITILELATENSQWKATSKSSAGQHVPLAIEMYQPLAPPIEQYLERGYNSYLDDSLIRVYFLQLVTPVEAASTCQRAHDTYARDILGRPGSGIEAPDLFKIYNAERKSFHSVEECWEDFKIFLQSTYSDQNCPENPTEFPLGFVVLTAPDSQRATLVRCFKEDEQWNVGSCLIPIDADLGMQAQALKYTEDEFANFARHYENDLPRRSP